jgi:hypothetical protein
MTDTRSLTDEEIRTEWTRRNVTSAEVQARADDDDDDTTDTDTTDTSDTTDTTDTSDTTDTDTRDA